MLVFVVVGGFVYCFVCFSGIVSLVCWCWLLGFRS